MQLLLRMHLVPIFGVDHRMLARSLAKRDAAVAARQIFFSVWHGTAWPDVQQLCGARSIFRIPVWHDSAMMDARTHALSFLLSGIIRSGV